MIEIIKQGKIPYSDIKTFNCCHCGAEFTGDRRDYSVELCADKPAMVYRLACPCYGTECTVWVSRERE